MTTTNDAFFSLHPSARACFFLISFFYLYYETKHALAHVWWQKKRSSTFDKIKKKNKNDTSHAHKTTHKKRRTGKKMKRKRPEKGLEERGSIVPQILPRVKRGTVHSTLRLRETSVPKPGRNVHRLRAFYRAIVPDNTVSCWGDLSFT